MSWPSLFIGMALSLALVGAPWGLVSSYRAMKAEDTTRAASQRGEGDS